MRKLIENVLPLAAVLALFAVPGMATAQEEEEAQEALQECTVEFAPPEVETGKAAVQLTAAFSSDIGVVRELYAPEGSGIALAAPEDLAMVQMARGETEEGEEAAEPQPIVMVGGTNQATIWLNTQDAQPGTHQVTLKGATGDCTAELTVKEISGESN